MRNSKQRKNNSVASSIKLLAIVVFILKIAGCTIVYDEKDGAPLNPIDLSQVKEPIPKYEPKSKYGNPESYKVLGKRYYTMDGSSGFKQSGLASWYGTKFHGKKTSSGEPYDMYAMTGAHKTLPLPTYAKVTNKANGKSVIIKINDRGPFHTDRILDLSYAAAHKIGLVGTGTASIELAAIDPNAKKKEPVPHDLKHNLKHNPKHNIKADGVLITMQLGSFMDRKKALQLTTKASELFDHPIRLQNVKSKTSDKSIYRVNLGPFPAANSDEVISKLAAINITNPIILKDNKIKNTNIAVKTTTTKTTKTTISKTNKTISKPIKTAVNNNKDLALNNDTPF